MSVKGDLIAARALIDTPEKWIKGTYEAHGCMCALGACRKQIYGTTWHLDDDTWAGDENALSFALSRSVPAAFGGSVSDFNDDPTTTHADIMALFDRAIEAAE